MAARRHAARHADRDTLPHVGRTTGILGSPLRATVTPWGDVVPWDGSEPLTWAIAADDRWHFPHSEVSTRQTSVRGTPVLETRVRVPNGDVVEHVWSASLREGVTAILVEFTNDSPMPVVIALGRGDVVSSRSFHRFDASRYPWPSQDRGVDPPALVIPLGHRSHTRIALVRTGEITPDDVELFPDQESVVRGWVAMTDRSSSMEIPQVVAGTPVDDVMRAVRSESALVPGTLDGKSLDRTVRWLVAHRELVRMGLAEPDLPEIATALEVVFGHIRRTRCIDPSDAVALRTGAHLLGRHDQRAYVDFMRAVDKAQRRCRLDVSDDPDLVRRLAALPSEATLDDAGGGESLDVISSIESEIAVWSARDEVTLVPNGLASFGFGVNFEAHRVPAGPMHTISLAVRWHGERPAVIWEVDGPAGLVVRSGADPLWSSVEPAGEALWASPADSPDSGRFEDLRQTFEA